MYKWDGKSYIRSVVVAMDKTHAKEILVTDLDKDGRDELYVVNEAVKIGSAIITPVQIVRYTKGEAMERGTREHTTKHTPAFCSHPQVPRPELPFPPQRQPVAMVC